MMQSANVVLQIPIYSYAFYLVISESLVDICTKTLRDELIQPPIPYLQKSEKLSKLNTIYFPNEGLQSQKSGE